MNYTINQFEKADCILLNLEHFLLTLIPIVKEIQSVFHKQQTKVLTNLLTMLKGISSVVNPSLLEVLSSMGHGDEIVLADAHFPGETFNKRVLRADGVSIPALLEGILPLFELDTYVPDPLIMMAAVEGDALDPSVEERYMLSIHKSNPDIKKIHRIDRFKFYERTKSAFAVVMTGETAKYGNIILKKGVTPV